ncbi:E3 ubiquitin-protein ligase RHA1B [Vitis vinifera]|uniref:E3 ubiquitin-protein ligase RHA1B n=1 Tax=Vitis vinifera TaxID=29760 RepID=A0A438J581_VITVI|nr:E3 ubiquitin-protein ligase RHA1B [Vitis vinifera]
MGPSGCGLILSLAFNGEEWGRLSESSRPKNKTGPFLTFSIFHYPISLLLLYNATSLLSLSPTPSLSRFLSFSSSLLSATVHVPQIHHKFTTTGYSIPKKNHGFSSGLHGASPPETSSAHAFSSGFHQKTHLLLLPLPGSHRFSGTGHCVDGGVDPGAGISVGVGGSDPGDPPGDEVRGAGGAGAGDPPDQCAVCLYEFEGQEEIRRLTNCRHIFHRSCLDRWMDCDQKTCPLCRTPFIPDDMQEAFNERLWAASALPDFYGDYSPLGL